MFPRFKNHEGSKKHRENVTRLREVMMEEEETMNGETGADQPDAHAAPHSADEGSGDSGELVWSRLATTVVCRGVGSVNRNGF